jgi:hypothetical protein
MGMSLEFPYRGYSCPLQAEAPLNAAADTPPHMFTTITQVMAYDSFLRL